MMNLILRWIEVRGEIIMAKEKVNMIGSGVLSKTLSLFNFIQEGNGRGDQIVFMPDNIWIKRLFSTQEDMLR